METHSSILAWRIPWTEQRGGLQSTGLQRVGQTHFRASDPEAGEFLRCSEHTGHTRETLVFDTCVSGRKERWCKPGVLASLAFPSLQFSVSNFTFGHLQNCLPWSLQSKGLSRVFSNTTVQKHQFFSTQPSSQSNSQPEKLLPPHPLL